MGSVGAAMPVTPADSNAASEMETDDKITTTIPDSYWAKYKVKVERPQYTDVEYETHLKNEDWSREETDYLVDLVYEFDLRWIIIADRYEYKPEMSKKSEDSTAVSAQVKPRTQEDMKARYYDVAAKTMVLHNPLSSMSSAEFDAHEKMTKYDAARETQRKKYAEQLMQRTEEEKYEEEMLLKELSRIVSNQEKLFTDRKALYERLEPAANQSRENYSTSVYQSHAGLTQLIQTLIAQNKSRELEKKEKRRSQIEAGDVGIPPGERSHRQSLSGTDKRASTSGESHRRQLSAREEAKWGVSHPNERLTGGVQFRHERVTKASQAKSGVQTSRIGAALTELKIPPRLVMPTAKVVAEYEGLIEKIKVLLEVRKLSEKLDAEVKVWKAHKEQAEAKERGEEVKEEEGQGDGTGVVEQEDDDDEAEKAEAAQNDVSKAEEDEEDEEEENGDGNDEEDKVAPRNDSEDGEADNQDEESDNKNNKDSASEDADADADTEEENDDGIEQEMRELQEDEEGEEEEQEHGGQIDDDAEDEDAEGDDADVNDNDNDDEADNNNNMPDIAAAASSVPPSPAPTSKSEGMRKRSASVISHVSNRSSKRQRK